MVRKRKKDSNIEQIREQLLAYGLLPRHIAIIMDGNGRWAKERGLPRIAGHNEGINSVREITRECGRLGIKVLTLYTFSKENWLRPKREVSALMNLLLNTIRKEVCELNKNNVKLTVIGHLEDLPAGPYNGILEGIEKTKSNTGLNLNLALSYEVASIGFSGRVSYQWVSEIYRGADENSEEWLDAANSLDLSLRQRLTANVRLFLKGKNLLGEDKIRRGRLEEAALR